MTAVNRTRLDGLPDLFEDWRFVRERVRESRNAERTGQVPYPTAAEALTALERQCWWRGRHGYISHG
jgi:hypothetical protein